MPNARTQTPRLTVGSRSFSAQRSPPPDSVHLRRQRPDTLPVLSFYYPRLSSLILARKNKIKKDEPFYFSGVFVDKTDRVSPSKKTRGRTAPSKVQRGNDMFTYTDANGRRHTVDFDVVDLLDARREDPPVLWYANNDTRAGRGECMRTRFGVAANPARLGTIRHSSEWRTAVEHYANDRRLDIEPIIADSIPRRNRRTTAQATAQAPRPNNADTAGQAVASRPITVPNSRTAREDSRQRLNPAVAGSRTARAQARQRLEAHTNPPPPPATTMPTRYFGVELEVISKVKRKPIQRALQRINVESWIGGYQRSVDGAWRLGTDASIDPSRTDMTEGYTEKLEIVSPKLAGEQGLAELGRVMEAIKPFMRTNESCGLHCHIDLLGISLQELKRITAAWLTKEWVVNTLIPEHRRYRNNPYCHDNGLSPTIAQQNWHGAQHQAIHRVARLRDMMDVRNEMGRGSNNRVSKYRKLNLKSAHGTCEFRYGPGSLDFDEVSNYVKFCLGFVEYHKNAERVKPDTQKPTLWRATAELLANVSEAVGDEEIPYYYLAKQTELRPS